MVNTCQGRPTFFWWQGATTITADWFAGRKFKVILSGTPTSPNDCAISLPCTSLQMQPSVPRFGHPDPNGARLFSTVIRTARSCT